MYCKDRSLRYIPQDEDGKHGFQKGDLPIKLGQYQSHELLFDITPHLPSVDRNGFARSENAQSHFSDAVTGNIPP